MKEIRPKYEVCPACRGTGLEYETARLLIERKQEITKPELTYLICKKLNTKSYDTDLKSFINMRITKSDLFAIIKQRGLLIPCHYCSGKGKSNNITHFLENSEY